MKNIFLLLAAATVVCLVGCEDPKLVTCMEERQALQAQVGDAEKAIAEKDGEIENLKTKNIEMQTQTMENIQVMMNKQAENDKQLKVKIDNLTVLNKSLKGRITELENENKHLQGVCDQREASLETANKENQKLIKQLSDIKKAVSR